MGRVALIALILAVPCLLSGCMGAKRGTDGTVRLDQELARGLDEGFSGLEQLVSVVGAYREGAGHWPESPEVLRQSPWVAVDWEAYENLRFEALPKGALAITFDRWSSPQGNTTAEGARIVLRPNPAAPPERESAPPLSE